MKRDKAPARTRSYILNYIVEQWKQNFSGTSALELAEGFGLTHREAMKRLEALACGNKVYLRTAQLGEPIEFGELERDDGSIIAIPTNWRMVDTFVAFPKRHVLEKAFAEEDKDYGVFTNRLHQGDSQLSHYYFRQDVLDGYLSYPDRYHIHDDVVDGQILTKDAYYFSLAEDRRGSETFAQIRYGKRRLKQGNVAIAAIAKDLSGLPYQQQQYWASFEIKNPQFAEEDEEYEKYWLQSFEAQFVNHKDPLQEVYGVLGSINDLVGDKLFCCTSENPHLRYPVKNTNEAYQNAHKELYKLLGSGSLKQEVLLDVLRQLGATEEQLKGDKRQWKGNWDLFGVLVEKVPGASFAPLQRCSKARHQDAHVIGTPGFPDVDLTQKFRVDCMEILETLKRLEFYLKGQMRLDLQHG